MAVFEDETGGARPPETERPHGSSEHGQPFAGEDLGRVLSLSDGIFAFAMTLLVLSLTIPTVHLSAGQLSSYLAGAEHQIATYTISFLIIGTWWVSHHNLFRQIRRWDHRLVWLNLGFLLTIAISPFVIGVFINEGPSFPSVALAGGLWAISGFFLSTIWLYAACARRLVDPKLSPLYVRTYGLLSVVGPSIFLGSVGVALLSPTIAEYAWLAVFFVQRLGQYVSQRALPDRRRPVRRDAGAAAGPD